MTRATLAELLDASPSRIDVLLDQLAAALESAGLRLHDGPDGVTIVPDAAVRDPERLRGGCCRPSTPRTG